MRAGDLDRRIELQRFTVIGVDSDYNTEITDWATLANVWAKVTELPGREYLADTSQEVAERRAVFTIRWRADVGVTDRVVWDGDFFDIENVREIGRRVGLELQARAATE